MYIQYNKKKLSSYDSACLNILGSALVRYIIIKNYAQIESFDRRFLESDTDHVKVLKYFIEVISNFEILSENPNFLEKICELNERTIKELGQKTYTEHITSLNSISSVSLVSETTNFEKKISVSLLRIALSATTEMSEELLTELREKSFSNIQKDRLKQKSELMKRVILKLESDLSFINKIRKDFEKDKDLLQASNRL